jgi:hypothetical protein
VTGVTRAGDPLRVVPDGLPQQVDDRAEDRIVRPDGTRQQHG